MSERLEMTLKSDDRNGVNEQVAEISIETYAARNPVDFERFLSCEMFEGELLAIKLETLLRRSGCETGRVQNGRRTSDESLLETERKRSI